MEVFVKKKVGRKNKSIFYAGSSLDLVRTAKLVLDEYFSLTGV
jgi:hypothetical protein